MDENTDSFPAWVPEAEKNATPPDARETELVIITGMSGAGRSRAADVLEDLNWYVVDNLPPRLLGALTGLIQPSGQGRKIAVVVDVRSREFFAELVTVIGQLRVTGISYKMLFLDCDDQELVKRYENVRRPHPLQGDGALLEAVTAERELLAPLRKRSDIIIDTSNLSVHNLARQVRSLLALEAETAIRVTVMSFGFKYGVPLDADHMIDVRFLANPYWVGELRHLTGHDEQVKEYVLRQPLAEDFVARYVDLVAMLMEGYRNQLKSRLTIAIGCTGGKHRSVALTEIVAVKLRERGIAATTQHRDLGKE